ncbi:MAG TPA: hypothetical protein QGF58_09065 [Myxococcota bacterium]|nr:hypothetical protein [Myxococcota bacterium]
MRHLTAAALFLTSLATLTACGPAICTEIAVSSVTLELYDLDTGEGVVGADVQYAVDGGDFGPCRSWGEDHIYNCGVEEPGAFEIAVDAEGYELLEVAADVDEDECHVITEVLVEDLVPLAEAR